MWKTVETKAKKAQVAEIKGGREKKRRGKETRREEIEKRRKRENKTEKGKNNESKEGGRRVGNFG